MIKQLGIGGIHKTIDLKQVKWNGEQKLVNESVRNIYPNIKELKKEGI